jgi:DNA-binding response OmpR family regulator
MILAKNPPLAPASTAPVLLIYEGAPPESALLAHLSAYNVKQTPTQFLDHVATHNDLKVCALVILNAATSLSRGRVLATRVRGITSAPLLLLAPSEPAEDAFAVLRETVDVMLSPAASPAIIAGHAAALLRRCPCAAVATAPPQPSHGYRDSLLEIDIDRHNVRVDGRHVQLTPTEFRLLSYLAQQPGVLLTYQQILNHVWGWEASEHRIVHTFAAQLRTKLGERVAPYLVNEYGSGYRFSPPPQPSA